jgi:hypothetical protein
MWSLGRGAARPARIPVSPHQRWQGKGLGRTPSSPGADSWSKLWRNDRRRWSAAAQGSGGRWCPNFGKTATNADQQATQEVLLGGQGGASVLNFPMCGLERGGCRGGVNGERWTRAGPREEIVR